MPRGAANPCGLPRGWVGPHLDVQIEPQPDARQLLISGRHHAYDAARAQLRVRVCIEGRPAGRFALDAAGAFVWLVPLPAGFVAPLRVEIDSEPYFIPDEILRNGDARRLCFVLDALQPLP